MVGRKRRRQQPSCHLPIHRTGQWAKPQGGLNFEDVFPSGLIAYGVVANMLGFETELLGDERAKRLGRLLALLKDAPWKSEVTEHNGEAQAIGIAAAPIDQGQVIGAEGVMARHPAFIARRGRETDPLRLGKQLSVCHGCPF